VAASALALTGAAYVPAAAGPHPVSGIEDLVDRAEARANLVCARPAAQDATGASFVRCVDALGEPIRLFYSADATLIAAAATTLVDAGWATAGHGAVRVGVRGGLAPSMARSIAGLVG